MRKGSPAYKRIVELHLYAALTTGVILVVVSVTGCPLIFERKMDRWFDSGVSYVTPTGPPLTISKVLARLEALLPDQKVRQLEFDDPEASVVATMSDKSRAYINGYTEELLGTRKSPPLTFHVRQMHKTLLAGRIVMITTVALLFQCFSGIS
jgi:uncharacterized iron-regulated membrane protein